MRCCRHPSTLVLVAMAAGVLPAACVAAPDDFRVLTDRIAGQGEVEAELQSAFVRPRRGGPTQLQGLAELSYGVHRRLEVSLQVPVSRDDGHWRGEGANIELQYVAPHGDRGWYWGARAELGRGRGAREEQATTSLELRPMVGYRAGAWHGVVNAAVRAALRGPDRHAAWEPAAKVARAIGRESALGIEYYVQAAERSGAAPAPRQQLALLVADTRLAGASLNLGIGRGWRGRDGAVVKAIASFDLD